MAYLKKNKKIYMWKNSYILLQHKFIILLLYESKYNNYIYLYHKGLTFLYRRITYESVIWVNLKHKDV
ncbi:hypothetical protein PFAG_01386 [Plasmodium falciparum Santa Lucia]|uniref:Uncharacterized protein n=1 Tax=Plasmodium falciparum Santa Lucia TaxID=478859 RepID=W7FME4_PLAFA|nr:hypothetical protein PFAG_01386 [Plasmodium falciparum Santa Lucia]